MSSIRWRILVTIRENSVFVTIRYSLTNSTANIGIFDKYLFNKSTIRKLEYRPPSEQWAQLTGSTPHTAIRKTPVTAISWFFKCFDITALLPCVEIEIEIIFNIQSKQIDKLSILDVFGHNFGGWGGSPAFCRCRTGQFAAMRAAKCGKFSAYFRPVTHYGMVIKR